MQVKLSLKRQKNKAELHIMLNSEAKLHIISENKAALRFMSSAHTSGA